LLTASEEGRADGELILVDQTMSRELRHDGAAAEDDVPADLDQEEPGTALARSNFCPTVPAFFSWLGVTQYLTREANIATLRGIATYSAAGSEFVFTYVAERELDPDQQSVNAQSHRTLALRLRPSATGS
jgi:O-methyltransferase involved in polyketide biosynthesis